MIIFDFLTLLFKNIEIPFYLIPTTFVFLTLLLILFAIDKFFKFLQHIKIKLFALIIATIIIANPITVSLGLKMRLAFALVFYGLTNLFLTKKNYYILYLILGFLTHTSSFLLILSYFLSKSFKPNKSTTIILALTSFLMSTVLLNFAFELPIISNTFSTLSVYKEFDNLSDKSARGLLFYYIDITVKLSIIATYFFILSL